MQTMDEITFEKAMQYFGRSADALLIADPNADAYRALLRNGIFRDVLADSGTYKDLVQKLWFHFSESGRNITEEYQVFIPNLSRFSGKYCKHLTVTVGETQHNVQMLIHPVENSDLYLFLLDELDERVLEDDTDTMQKVSTIQNIYLFSMCFDLERDTTSSLSLTEVSDETMNSQISYSAWRQMIVNMIWKNDQALFMERSDPAYLRTHFAPGEVESFDCQMQNLDGVYIWVKLIFSRMDTTNEDDFRFVYMVQNIHDTTVSMRAALRHYEELASRDTLTQVFNHGRIETELCNAVQRHRKDGTPIALLILDIDHFKSVNDRFGHAVGDATLVRFTEVVRNMLGEREHAFGRWGGEEFAAVIYNLGEAGVQPFAEALRIRISEEEYEGVGAITCSIGASVLKRDDVIESWFERADQALYTAKEEGRNRVCIC